MIGRMLACVARFDRVATGSVRVTTRRRNVGEAV